MDITKVTDLRQPLQTSGLQLTADQRAGLQDILDFLVDPTAKVLVLKGYAGVGKSTLIQEVVREVGRQKMVAFTAPTNKAAKVLREMAINSGTPVAHVSTIYSLLGLTLQANGDVKEIGRGGKSQAAAFDIIVVDEASMVNLALYEYIAEDTSMLHTKIIFMGDPLQLPPVGEDLSPAFNKSDYQVELKEVVRQAADNPIIQLTASIRESIEADRMTFEWATQKSDDGHGIYVLKRDKWDVWMRAGFKSEAYTEDGDAFRTVAWRNITVDYYNERIRDSLYGEQASEPFLVGERVLNASPLKDLDEDMIVAPTDSEGIVRSVAIGIHPWLKKRRLGEFKVYHLTIAYEEAGLVDVYVQHPDDDKAVAKKLKSLSAEAKKDRKLWGTFWAFKEAFADIRPAHAITSHRSQGSTYDNVFVDVHDISKNRNWTESMKSLYVACSRARNNLMVLL